MTDGNVDLKCFGVLLVCILHSGSESHLERFKSAFFPTLFERRNNHDLSGSK